MPAPSNKKPIMDVAKPGDTAATATSRPVIINHGMLVKDPMMQDKGDEAASELAAEENTPKITQSKKILVPIETTEAASEKRENKTDDPEKEEATNSESEEEQVEEAVVDAVVDQMADKKEQDKAAEEDQKREELVAKLVSEKKYFVPLAVARHSRNNKIGIVVISMLIPLIVGIVLAIDAGVIGENISLPFDLIK